MHLEGPWLSTTGKRKGKFKWASADAKRRQQSLEKEWQDLKSKYNIEQEEKKKKQALSAKKLVYSLKPPPGRTTTDNIKSHDSGLGNAAKKATPVYTGDNVMGVTILHKSCLQPVFNQQQAIDAASMRR